MFINREVGYFVEKIEIQNMNEMALIKRETNRTEKVFSGSAFNFGRRKILFVAFKDNGKLITKEKKYIVSVRNVSLQICITWKNTISCNI